MSVFLLQAFLKQFKKTAANKVFHQIIEWFRLEDRLIPTPLL